MSRAFKDFLLRWAINTVAVGLTACVVHGIDYDRTSTLLAAAFLLGILNTFLRPLLMLLSLPLLIFTLGLFMMFINAVLLYWVSKIVKGFHVESFYAAFWGALVISVVSMILNALAGVGNAQIRVHRGGPPPPSNRRDDGGGGPVIDV